MAGRKLKLDPALFLATFLLVAVGLVMVYSASAPYALAYHQPQYYYLTKQVMWAVLGTAVLSLAMGFDYRHYREPALVGAGLAVTLLALTAVLFCPPINGARRWFSLGGVSLQPSEFAKLAMIFFTARILEQRMARIDDVKYSLSPIVLVAGTVAALVLLQPDLGTALAISAIVAAMVFAAGLAYRYVLAAVVPLTALAALLVVGAGYRRARWLAFLDPWKDRLGDGYQIIQSLVAVGTGGVTGRGLGGSVQKLSYLPFPHTDFIYAVLGEELGLIGATAVLVCFCVIAWRGLRVAARAPDAFGSLVALGITVMIAMQALVNISVVLGLLPTKGIPLPLVSSGGSSLLVSLAGLGVLLNISQHASVTRT